MKHDVICIGAGGHAKVCIELLRAMGETVAFCIADETSLDDCLGVPILKGDEDSLGYVAMEAATAEKALITADDSGGILGLVQHEKTGWVSQANPEALAKAMNAVFKSTKTTRHYGLDLKKLWQGMGIEWPKTIEALLE